MFLGTAYAGTICPTASSGVTLQAGVVGEGNAAVLGLLGATVGTEATLTFNTAPTVLDVLKIQTLDAGLSATVSDNGLRDSFGGASQTPEPATYLLCGSVVRRSDGAVGGCGALQKSRRETRLTGSGSPRDGRQRVSTPPIVT
jgi:hypothetical protein